MALLCVKQQEVDFMKTFCQHSLFKQTLLWVVLASFLKNTYAKVEPPNYDFSLDKFRLFFPGAKRADIKKEYKSEELVLTTGPYQTYKYYVTHIRYRFPILVQYKNDIVTDFHARLPAYFLHDVFHQSIINRFGKQDRYKNDKEQSIYVWNNIENNRHTYVGACSVTCFPIFYAVRKIDLEKEGDYKPILQQLKVNEDKTRLLPQSEAGT